MKCLCSTTRRAARLLTVYYEDALRPANLTPSQFELLATLSARPDLAQTAIAEAIAVDQTTLSRNLKLLIGRKWVRRAASSADRRQSVYSLTPAGRRIWREALPSWRHAQDQIRESLGSDWLNVWATLERLTNSMVIIPSRQV
jgi:DNA-binding MarR family transcriptional regulator